MWPGREGGRQDWKGEVHGRGSEDHGRRPAPRPCSRAGLAVQHPIWLAGGPRLYSSRAAVEKVPRGDTNRAWMT